MAFWTGTMFLGKVEAIGEESIQTKLFILGVPLLPVSSWFVVREQFRGVQGFEIPLHGRSVGLAHLRMVGAYGALGCGIAAVVMRDRARHDPSGCWIAFGALAAGMLYSKFVLGGPLLLHHGLTRPSSLPRPSSNARRSHDAQRHRLQRNLG